MEEQQNQQIENQAEPELLYHYTTEKGLYGILDKDAIWASHFRFLNDFKELHDFIVWIKKRIEQREKYTSSSQSGNQIRKVLGEKAIQNLKHFVETLDVFLLSLTVDRDSPMRGDRLSQWRGYGNDGRVFSLGFYPDILKLKVKEFGEQNQLPIFEGPLLCEYGENDERNLVKTAITCYFNIDEIGRKQIQPNSDLASWLIREMTVFKNEGFYEEKEQRFVFQLSDTMRHNHLIGFHDNSIGRAPHISIPLGLKEQNSPLMKITVRPTPETEQVAIRLRIVLEKMGIFGVNVVPSQIPYRNW